MAKASMLESGLKEKDNKKELVDEISATLILQSLWIQQHTNYDITNSSF